jgi:hypothetical protein
MVSRILVVVLALGSFAACGGGNGTQATQCKATSECPTGEVCNQNSCTKTCDTTTLCPGGYTCQSGLCTTGSTGSPVINSVAGMSSQTCGANGPCIGGGFVVTGQHLSATAFTLTGPGDNGFKYAMTRSDGGTSDSSATVIPTLQARQSDLQPGTYTLTAVNASGNSSAGLSLLQGEPGPDLSGNDLISRINSATTGKIQGKFLDVAGGGSGGGASGTLSSWTDTDGDTASTDTAINVREMQITVTAGADAVSHKINQTDLSTFCGDADGCEVTLGATGFHDTTTATDYQINALLNGGSCRFFWKNNAWTVSENCVAIYKIYTKSADGSSYVDGGAYQNYNYANSYGIGGSSPGGAYTCSAASSTQNGDPDGQPLIVMSFKGACYFAESPADTSKPATGCMTADTDADFYLIASSSTWDYPGAFPTKTGPDVRDPWSGAGRTCVLTIRD